MPNQNPNSNVPAAAGRRIRAAAQRGTGGASSMLRLSRGAESRLPSGAALSDWAERAAAMLDLTPMMVGPRAPALRPGAATATAPFILGTPEARA